METIGIVCSDAADKGSSPLPTVIHTCVVDKRDYNDTFHTRNKTHHASLLACMDATYPSMPLTKPKPRQAEQNFTDFVNRVIDNQAKRTYS